MLVRGWTPQDPFVHCWWKCKTVQHLEDSLAVSYKGPLPYNGMVPLPYHAAITQLGICPKELKTQT